MRIGAPGLLVRRGKIARLPATSSLTRTRTKTQRSLKSPLRQPRSPRRRGEARLVGGHVEEDAAVVVVEGEVLLLQQLPQTLGLGRTRPPRKRNRAQQGLRAAGDEDVVEAAVEVRRRRRRLGFNIPGR